jgi:hypothetical protein
MRQTGDHKFANVSASSGEAFNVALAARGAAFGDLDDDGDVDIVISVLNGAPVVLRNNGTKNHWLGVKLVGTKSNRQGVGARVIAADERGRKTICDVTTASSYLSANDPRVLIGLGAATSVRSIEVRWPSGQVQHIANPPVDRYNTIKEP